MKKNIVAYSVISNLWINFISKICFNHFIHLNSMFWVPLKLAKLIENLGVNLKKDGNMVFVSTNKSCKAPVFCLN